MSNAICKWCKREWLHLGMDDKCPYCRVRELEAAWAFAAGDIVEMNSCEGMHRLLSAVGLTWPGESAIAPTSPVVWETKCKEAEAERDALRERCETLGHELGMSKRNEARWIEKGEGAISERNAANKALEAIKRHQEIVAGTGTAQMSTTWKIANDYLRSRGAALAATEVKP